MEVALSMREQIIPGQGHKITVAMREFLLSSKTLSSSIGAKLGHVCYPELVALLSFVFVFQLALVAGTARDVSFVIDFLPSYLFPHDESKIESWGVVGISLGGHSTWIVLSQGIVMPTY